MIHGIVDSFLRSLPPVDISASTYDNKSFVFSTSVTRGFCWCNNGAYFMISQFSAGADRVERYSPLTSYQIDSLGLDAVSSGATQTPTSIHVDNEGSLVMLNLEITKIINQYDFVTAYDVQTLPNLTADDTVTLSDMAASYRCTFTPSFDAVYILDNDSGLYINKYDLTSAKVISTATYVNQSSLLTSVVSGSSITCLAVDAQEKYIYAGSTSDDNILQLEMTTPGDITTLTDTGLRFDVSSQVSGIDGLWFRQDDMSQFWVADNFTIYQYATGFS